ncbi:MAG: cadherin domain-containing protein [Bacteroidota bacterium]
MKTKGLVSVLIMLLTFRLGIASPPPTWSVNPASFQYSMTVTAVANINCTELLSPSNRVGAFVGATCRGTVLTSNVINGRFIASMVVYSNVPSGETITFKIYNAANDSVYDAKVTADFQDNASYGATVSPFVIRNNNQPTALNLSSSTVNEGLAVNTVVGTLTSTDPDAGETFTYTLVSGSGSTDNGNFNISGDQLRTSSVLNYNQKTSHAIRIRTTDANGCAFEQTFTISVQDINTTPTNIFLSDTTVNENLSSLATVGTLSALDPDLGESHSYSLVSGAGSADNGSFNIAGALLRTSSTFNYELKSSYNIRIRVTDISNNTFERAFTIVIIDQNDQPTNIQLGGSNVGVSLAENRPLGSFVADFSTIDEDAGNSFTYSFVSVQGNDNAQFSIVGSQLRTNALFDYESRQNYVVFIQTNDGNGGLYSKQFSLTVSDSNDAPTDIALTNTAIGENLPVNTFIGKLSAIDPDATGTYTFTLINGAGSGGNTNVRISNDSLYTNVLYDYEQAASFSIRVSVNDGSQGTYQRTFTISVIDNNDAPTNVLLTSNQIAENLNANSVIGQLSTIDQDPSNTFSYTLVTGAGATDNSSFNISGNNLRSSMAFDFETKNSYSVRIRTTDNAGAFFEKVFTIDVTNVIDVPTNIVLTNDTVNENMAVNTLIGSFSSVCQDTGIAFVYSFNNSISGNDNSSFLIAGNQLRTNGVFNYEAKSLYNIYVTTSSGSVSYSRLIQINVRDINDAPTDIALSISNINENRPAGSFIGMFSSTDPDQGNTFTYSLVNGLGGNNNALFAIRNDSLFTSAVLDFETVSTFSIRVATTDNGSLSFQKVFTIMVNDSNDVPTAVNLSASSVNENSLLGTVVGVLSTVDADAGQSFTYSLVAGVGSSNNNLFSIVGNQLRTNAVFNFETLPSLLIRIQTNDGNGGTFSDTFRISVLDINDMPTNITLSNANSTENRPVGSVIGTLTTTDEDVNDVFSYSLTTGGNNDNVFFLISGNELKINTVADFESKKLYVIQIQTSDGKGGNFTKQFVINITDSNDAPVNTTLITSSIDENKPTRSFIGIFYTNDADQNDAFSYSFVSGSGAVDNGSFWIQNDTLYSNEVFNFESKNIYSIRVRVTDVGGLSFIRQLDVSISDANDAPTDIVLSSDEIAEKRANRSVVARLSSTDEDANTFTYSLVSGTGSDDNASFVIQGGELRSNRVFNYELQKTYAIRISTNDGRGGTFQKAFVITILDSSDAPTNIILSKSTVPENSVIGTVVCTMSTIDEDTLDAFTYAFANINGNNNDKFFIVGNELRTTEVFDYETKKFYLVFLQTSDAAGNMFVRQFVINVTDTNDAPTALTISNLSVSENLPVGSYVGSFTSTDADQTSGFVYTLVGGTGSNDNIRFTVQNDSLLTNLSFNFEAKQSYSIRVRTTDVTNEIFERVFVVNITDANDGPTDLLLSNKVLNENAPKQTIVGNFSTVDIDAVDAHTYAFVPGIGDADNASFIIDQNKLLANFSANFEVKSTYNIRVKSTDSGGDTIDRAFVITIADVSEKPTINNQRFDISEMAATGEDVGIVLSSSPDAGANLKYILTDAEQLPFALNENTGELTVVSALDYEKTKEYKLSVIVKDDQPTALYDTAVITVQVNDEIELNLDLPANNFMSPNGDGINDYFAVQNVQLYANYSLTIYNESGMEVYKIISNYKNDWDGSYDGKRLPTGVYYFIFRNPANGDEFKGALNIVK